MSELNNRTNNRANGPLLLAAAGVEFTSHNDGAHLIIDNSDLGMIDYWPGTGKWNIRKNGTKHRGVNNLIRLLTLEA